MFCPPKTDFFLNVSFPVARVWGAHRTPKLRAGVVNVFSFFTPFSMIYVFPTHCKPLCAEKNSSQTQ